MIQVIGKTGMLGSEVIKAAQDANIDVLDGYVDIISVMPQDIRGEVVINCSGISPTATGREKLIAVNQSGPRKLAEVCSEVGARLIHVSTDAVYNRPGPHPESHHCDPSSLYGRTKMMGEVKSPPHLTLRTSFIGFGRRGIVAQLLTTEDVIPASTKFLWNGHTAPTVAAILVALSQRPDITGLLHTPGVFQTRYDLVLRLIQLFSIDADRIKRDDSYITDRRLISTRWWSLDLPAPASFDEQLVSLRDEYEHDYSHTHPSAESLKFPR